MPKQEILQESIYNLVVALSDTEVGKIVLPKTWQWVDATTGKPTAFLNNSPTLEHEITTLQYANTINDLMPKFIRKDIWQAEDGKEHGMMVMERLYPLPFNHFDVQIREPMMKIFTIKLKQLHDELFVHGDLIRPTNYFTRDNKDWAFGNIIQTEDGLRLIDTGFARIYSEKIRKEFVHTLVREGHEIDVVKDFYLSY